MVEIKMLLLLISFSIVKPIIIYTQEFTLKVSWTDEVPKYVVEATQIISGGRHFN